MADIYGTTSPDTIDGTEENDNIFGLAGDDDLSGMRGNDILYGGEGNDTLDGASPVVQSFSDSGADTLIGETGDDTYNIGYGDTIVENFNEGIDTVISFNAGSSFTLGDNLENLTINYSYRGRGDVYGYGNELDNIINGGAPNNVYLYGLAGNDTLNSLGYGVTLDGGAGNDTLNLGGAFGRGSGGTGDDALIGVGGNDRLFGDEGNDYLKGNGANDYLNGGEGSDALTGGAGADTFTFSSPLEGIDTIWDFASSEGDKIQIDDSGFGIGQGQYDKFTFNSSTGALFFEQTQLAWLQAGTDFVTNRDITIV